LEKKMSFQWMDDYASGDAAVDTAKKALFELSEQLAATDDWTALRTTILALYKQMKALFEMEEASMRQANDGALEAHSRQHADFLERLADRSTDVGKGRMNKIAIVKVMTDWAQNHVPVADVAAAQVVRSRA